jgi:RNA polymerase sigma factor (sigma-70 family)
MGANAKTSPPSLVELLQHAAWTRQLARSLVGTGDADDLVQDTWVAAMHRPPDTTKPVRPWLGTVVRNNAFNRSRSAARRGARETAGEVVSRQVPETAEALLGRLELHKILVEAVAELAEPYRRMVLLAYFEGLTSVEIGASENLPPGTVRGRLKTALDLLREALDRRLGDRGAWLVPLTELTSSGAGAVGAVAAGVAGFTVRALAAFVGVLAVLATGVTLWKLTRPSAQPPAAAESRVVEPTPMGSPDATSSVASSAGAAAASNTGAVAEKERADVRVSAERLAARFPAIPPASSPPPAPPFSYTPPAGRSAAGTDTCTIATKGNSAVVKACAAGGRPEAKKLMKGMVKQAKARGQKFLCDGCHRDLDSYVLTPHAREDLEGLEAVLARP